MKIDHEWISTKRSESSKLVQRLLVLRLLLLALSLWSLNLAGQRIEDVLPNDPKLAIEQNRLLRLTFSATLHPQVTNRYKDFRRQVDESPGAPAWKVELVNSTTQREIDLVTSVLETAIKERYDSIFSLNLKILGNTLPIDLRLSIWFLPFLVFGIEILILVARLKRRFCERIFERLGDDPGSGDLSRQDLLDKALRTHPEGMVSKGYYWATCGLIGYGVFLILRTFPDAELYIWVNFWLFLAFLGWVYLKNVEAFYAAKVGEVTGSSLDSLSSVKRFPALRGLARRFTKPLPKISLGNACILLTLMLPMSCTGCGDLATGYEALTNTESTLFTTSLVLKDEYFDFDSDSSEESTPILPFLGRPDLFSILLYSFLLCLVPVSTMLLFSTYRKRWPKLVGWMGVTYSVAVRLALLEFGFGFPVIHGVEEAFEYLDYTSDHRGVLAGGVVLLILVALWLIPLRFKGLPTEGGDAVRRRRVGAFWAVGAWISLFFLTSMAGSLDEFLWGVPIYLGGLALLAAGFRELRLESLVWEGGEGSPAGVLSEEVVIEEPPRP
ncbi:MAG: hypothetical protein K0U98_27065 [Deltaproteobacteria bacterium]|nr:hypothetical protein [Deltaproteobacteria bacterium]